MAKPTPGPWVVNDFCTEGGADVAVWTSHDPHTAKAICECHFETHAQLARGETGCHQLEAEANARLIAAAPDLLALVRRYAGECAECEGTAERITADDQAVPCPDCADIRAAIAKATEVRS